MYEIPPKNIFYIVSQGAASVPPLVLTDIYPLKALLLLQYRQ